MYKAASNRILCLFSLMVSNVAIGFCHEMAKLRAGIAIGLKGWDFHSGFHTRFRAHGSFRPLMPGLLDDNIINPHSFSCLNGGETGINPGSFQPFPRITGKEWFTYLEGGQKELTFDNKIQTDAFLTGSGQRNPANLPTTILVHGYIASGYLTKETRVIQPHSTNGKEINNFFL